MKSRNGYADPLIAGVASAIIYILFTWGHSEWHIALGFFLGAVIGGYLFFIVKFFISKKRKRNNNKTEHSL